MNDNLNKHKKEKELDKYLYKAEKNRAEEIKLKTNKLEKAYDIFLHNKRDRKDNSESEIKIVENIQKEDVKEDDKIENFDLENSIFKILKHLKKENPKNEKCIGLIRSIFLHNFKELKYLIIFKILFTLSEALSFSNSNSHMNSLVDFYDFVEKEYSRLNENDVNKTIFEKIIHTFELPFKFRFNIITDDSFKFNETLKKVENLYFNLQPYNQTEDDAFQDFISIIENNPNNLINYDLIYLYLMRKFIFECIKQSYYTNKSKWAISSMNILLKKIYLEKEKLTNSQSEELDQMINSLKNKGNIINQSELSRTLIENKIKNNPSESYYQVTDARAEQTIDSGIDTWQSKQCGLSSGKMYINK